MYSASAHRETITCMTTSKPDLQDVRFLRQICVLLLQLVAQVVLVVCIFGIFTENARKSLLDVPSVLRERRIREVTAVRLLSGDLFV